MPLDLVVCVVVNIVIAIEIRRFVRRRRARLAREEEARRRHAAWLSEQLAAGEVAAGRMTIQYDRVPQMAFGHYDAPSGCVVWDDPVVPFPSVDRELEELLVSDLRDPAPEVGSVPMPTGGGAFGGAGVGGSWEADPETPSVADMAQAIDLVSPTASEPLGMTEAPDVGMSESPTPDADPTCSE